MISGYFFVCVTAKSNILQLDKKLGNFSNYHSSRKMHFSVFFRNKYLTKLFSKCSSKMSFSLKTFQCEIRCFFFQIIVGQKNVVSLHCLHSFWVNILCNSWFTSYVTTEVTSCE